MAAARFTLSYVVEKASCYPSYDIRVKDIAHPIILLVKANVSQQSGENWQNVKLTLSTGNLALTGVKPHLNTWYLNYNMSRFTSITLPANRAQISEVRGMITSEDGQPLPGVTVLIKGTAVGTCLLIKGL